MSLVEVKNIQREGFYIPGRLEVGVGKPVNLCCDRIKYVLACSVNYLKRGCLGKPVQSLVYLGRSTVPGHHKDLSNWQF